MINSQNIPFELQKLTNLFTQFEEKLLTDVGLTFSQFRILKLISDGIYQQNLISSELKISEPAVSRQIKNLKYAGLVKDKKANIDLTKKGLSAYEAAEEQLKNRYETIFKILPEREVKSFYTNLLLIKNFLENNIS